MCFKPPKPPPPQVMPTPPPVQPTVANTAAMKEGKLPEGRETTDPDDVRSVAFGGSKKQGEAAAGKKSNTQSLLIDANTGGTTGGMNV